VAAADVEVATVSVVGPQQRAPLSRASALAAGSQHAPAWAADSAGPQHGPPSAAPSVGVVGAVLAGVQQPPAVVAAAAAIVLFIGVLPATAWSRSQRRVARDRSWSGSV